MNDIELLMKILSENSYLDVSLKSPDLTGIEELEKLYQLNSDYRDLLKITDGFHLFNSGDHTLYCVKNVIEFNKYRELREDVYLIGYFLDNDIVIDSSKEEDYLYVGCPISSNEFMCLGNLSEFISNLIKSEGDVYWNYVDAELFDFGIEVK